MGELEYSLCYHANEISPQKFVSQIIKQGMCGMKTSKQTKDRIYLCSNGKKIKNSLCPYVRESEYMSPMGRK